MSMRLKLLAPCLIALTAFLFLKDIAHGQFSRRVSPQQSAHTTTESEVAIDSAPAAEVVDEEPEPRPLPEGDSVEIEADRIQYNADYTLMTAIGNVLVRQHEDTLRADFIEVNTETQDVLARGNVIFERAGQTWTGEEFSYNFKTREGDFGEFRVFTDPFYIQAKESQQISASVVRLQSPRLTTCSEDQRQEFQIRARSATITDGTILRARHVVAHLYGVPIFYTPVFRKNLSKNNTFEVIPGYSSRMGPFVLTRYHLYPAPHVRTSTQLDYRAKRGVGVGQHARWLSEDSSMRGRFQAYYTQDNRPIRSESQRAVREGLVDSERYWIGFQHTQPVGERNTLISDLNYVSDPFVLEDFFDSEFRYQVQPENRVTLTHRGEDFTAAIQLNMRMNDFFNNVNRLPELSLDFNRRQIGNTRLYYESRHSAGYLERVFPTSSDREDYNAFRVDSSHTVYYPMRHFGFLSLIPRAGYRGTWYSRVQPESMILTNQVPRLDAEGQQMIDDNGMLLFDEVTQTEEIGSGSSDLRNIFTFGLESSFKAFKVISENPNYLGTGLRHMFEPYADYTFVPDPNLQPDDLYQFDAIDRLGRRNDVRFGMRNKLQTRRGDNYVHDFIDLNTFTILSLDPEDDQNEFSDLFFDARVLLFDWMQIRFDGAYDWYENNIRMFNTQWSLLSRENSRWSFEYRYDRDRRQTVQSDLTLFPRQKWSYSGYWRYDIENEELEEQTYMVQRRFDCTMVGVGIRNRLDGERDHEWRAWAQVTLLAFPESELRLGR